MEMLFYFFLKSSVDDTPKSSPVCTSVFIGEIGEFVELDGVGYIITDYAVEQHYWDELINDSIWQ